LPFDADTPLAILMKHINDPLPLPRSLEPSVPEALERILLKTLAKNPDERHQNTLEVTKEINDAVREMNLFVPLSITHLQMLSIPQIKPGTVRVFSGTEKTNLPESEFNRGDTDVFHEVVGSKLDQSPKPGSRGVLTWITIMVLGNMLLLWASGVYGWDILVQSWPMELVLTGVLFFILMLENSCSWLIIPGGILVGNGLFLSYYTLSSRWEDWAIFWPLEPLIIAVSILTPFWLSKQTVRGKSLMHWLGKGTLVISGITFIVTLAFAIMISF
jgi:serine/threonine protein kinase